MITTQHDIGTPTTIAIGAIRAEAQIRTRNGFDRESLEGLAASIREHGLIQPIVVRPAEGEPDQFIVVAGERRLIACSMAGLDTIPALVRDVNTTCTRLGALQAIENIQREQLSLPDLAEGVAALVDAYGTVKTAAKFLGKSPAWVSKHAGLTRMHADVRAVLVSGVTQDPELLHTLNQIRRLPGGAGLDVFGKLVAGLEDGTTTREGARKALDKLKAPKIEQAPADDQDDDEGSAKDEPKDEVHTVTLRLNQEQYDALVALGGNVWVMEQIAKATPSNAF